MKTKTHPITRMTIMKLLFHFLVIFISTMSLGYCEDVYATFRVEAVRYLANVAMSLEKMSDEEVKQNLSLCEQMTEQRKIGKSLVGTEEANLFALTVKAAGSLDKADLEVSRIASDLAKKHGLLEQPEYKSLEDMEAFRKVWMSAKKLDLTVEIQAILLDRLVQRCPARNNEPTSK